MEEIIRGLSEWGAEPELALQRMLGDKTMYFRLLHMLLKELDQEELLLLVAAKRFHDAFVISHRLKGSSADLGLTPLFESLVLLTDDLRDPEHIRETLSFDLEEVDVRKTELRKIIGDD